MTTTQVQGFTLANLLEVEANTKAARVTLRPEDFGGLGIYSVGGVSGLMAAGLAGASRIFSFRWGDTTRLALVKRVTFSAGNDSTAFTAGTCLFNMFRAQSFTVSDTVGTSLVPTVNQNKLRTTGMGSSLLTSARIATTLAVSGGTITTTDAQPVGALCCSVPNVAGSAMLSPWPLFEAMPGEHPLVLAQDEGFLIQATVPATGTWKFSVRVDWTEIAAY
jgi:hypothetical protein